MPAAAQVPTSDEKPESAARPSSARSEVRRAEFAPGVRIDWKNRTVAVDARVVLREGPLELLACSPQTREHESILTIAARPLHIFQAMGLIGLEPGAPVAYDRENDEWFPPRGERIRLLITYRERERSVTVPIERWLRQVQTGKPPDAIDWVFSGSRTWPDGRFAADVDGTVACVVDFETALIAVGGLHSADNEFLWLEANSDEIPPIGTRCTLVISSAKGNAKATEDDRPGAGEPSVPPSTSVRPVERGRPADPG